MCSPFHLFAPGAFCCISKSIFELFFVNAPFPAKESLLEYSFIQLKHIKKYTKSSFLVCSRSVMPACTAYGPTLYLLQKRQRLTDFDFCFSKPNPADKRPNERTSSTKILSSLSSVVICWALVVIVGNCFSFRSST